VDCLTSLATNNKNVKARIRLHFFKTKLDILYSEIDAIFCVWKFRHTLFESVVSIKRHHKLVMNIQINRNKIEMLSPALNEPFTGQNNLLV